MNSDRWQQVQLLLESALERPEEARRAFVVSACGDDEDLGREVFSLLDAFERSPETLSPPTEWFRVLASPVPPRFESGQQVARRYRTGRLLGRGGTGEVYEAWDEELSIPVALKTLHLIHDTEQAHKQLKLEGLLARSVWHPHVCRIYDLGRHEEGEDAIWFLTMELLRGMTLAELLHAERRLALDRARRLGEQMAEGIGAAHRAGVVHRDFKTGNVMLVERDGVEHAVVTDFGIARTSRNPEFPTSADERGPILGTPAYMAPEQVRGEAVGPAADIYALGVVLYEIMTGMQPFAGDSPMEVAERRLLEDPVPPRKLVSDLDERWERVVLRCLERDPQRRFARAEDVAEALRGETPRHVDFTSDLSAGVRHTLPAERDAFFGREPESQDLARRLTGSTRLVTIVGAAGMGKTRLAVHHGWSRLRELPGGVWFCDLTEAHDLDGVVSAVARAFGIQLGGGDAVERLGHAIAGRGRCLVILDNFEQVAEHAAATVGRWLARTEKARFVVTSREKLSLGLDEHVLSVGSLPLEAGAELFAARARQLRPGLELAAEAEAVREIVRLVDGMPLAIELAGARMRIMSAAEILAQMRKRFSLLTGGASARHETLAIAIEGSWELLDSREQSAFVQCGVFEGGFTLEAAEAVIDLSEWGGETWVVDVVQSLVDKSLLRTWTPASGDTIAEPRIGMLMSLQEFARLKLRERSSSTAVSAERAAEERHGAWYAGYGTPSAIRAFKLENSPALRRRIELELDNLIAACSRAVTRRDAANAVAAYNASSAILHFRGPFGPALHLGRSILQTGFLERSQEALILRTLAQAEWYSGLAEESRAHLERSLAIAREIRDRHAEALALGDLGGVEFTQGKVEEGSVSLESALAIATEVGDVYLQTNTLNTLSATRRDQERTDEARAYAERALEVARAAGDRPLVGIVLNNLGLLLQDQGNNEAARAHYEEALVIHREMGYRRMEGNIHTNLGGLFCDLGLMDEASLHLKAALVIARETGGRFSEGTSLINLGFLYHTLERFEEARAYLEEALAIEQELGNQRLESNVIAGLGHLLQDCGELDQARTHYERALAIQRELHDRRSEAFTLTYLASLLHREGSVDAARDAIAEAEQRFREVDSPLGLGQLLCVRAELEHATGNAASALASFHEAQALAARLGSGPESELGRSISKLRQLFAD